MASIQLQFASHVDLTAIDAFVRNERRAVWAAPFTGLASLPLAGRSYAYLRTPMADADPRRRFINLDLRAGADVCSTIQIVKKLAYVADVSPLPGLTLGRNLASAPPTGAPANEIQWYLDRCCVPQTWKMPYTGAGVIVADLDGGFDVDHPEFAGRLTFQNLVDPAQSASIGDLSHGTGALGLIGAAHDGAGTAGFAPDATLWALQLLSTTIATKPVDHAALLAKTIDDCVTKMKAVTARGVVNIEFETAGERRIDQILIVKDAINRAMAADVVVCVPAGNGACDASLNDCDMPFTGSDAIIVGATQETLDKRTPESNYGTSVTVSAPGEEFNDYTTKPGGKYGEHYGGTSGATAKVAGAAALILEAKPGIKAASVKAALSSSAVKIPYKMMGGRIDCEAAIKAALALP